ncbi:hypothetical protein ACTG1T_09875 [Aeromonas veronii]|uniref:hypothetical protein n=1 Tax=Aeromonas TaxID=642 RepID=UPI00214DA82D|nr:hypothetical protein [Aeromonas veronii]MCR3962450.1 hypothetical protein [Aeromonas veronii]
MTFLGDIVAFNHGAKVVVSDMLASLTPSQDLDLDLEKARKRMIAYALKTNDAYRRNLKKPKKPCLCDSGLLAGKPKKTQ